MNQLETRKLTIGYGENALLSNLDLNLRSGEVVCLMGPNGSGKSTLIQTLAGIIKPLSGKISFFNKQPLDRTLAVVLTEKSFHPDLTGAEMVTMGRYPYLDWLMRLNPDDLKKIDLAMDRTGISHLKQMRNKNMSDGQRQMVMVARAIVQDTPILLLDEPTSHLDLNNRVEVMNLLRELAHKEKKSVLMATHELDLALQTADYVWLADGRGGVKTGVPEDLVLDGSIDEVFKLKGFTLKTGKVNHNPSSTKKIRLSGEGYAFLWTKNAVERIGIGLSTDAEASVEVKEENDQLVWIYDNRRITSISNLINALLHS